MKTIWLLRHAKSSWSEPGLADFDRTLAGRGKKDAPRIGRWMRKAESQPQLVLCSPAKRARQTAALVCEAFGYTGEIELRDALYPGAVPASLEMLSTLPASIDHVMLVGHNPHMEQLLSALVAGGSLRSRFSTTSLALVECDVADWSGVGPGTAVLRGLIAPRQLR